MKHGKTDIQANLKVGAGQTIDSFSDSVTNSNTSVPTGGAAKTYTDDKSGKNEQNIVLNAFRIAVNGSLTQQNMVDGIVDEYEDETGIDTASSTNESYDSVNDLYSPFAPELTTSPYAHYKMNDNAENTTVTDNGSGANNGTASTNVNNLASDGKVAVNGYFNGGGKFNGEETHLTIPDSADWDLFGSATGEWTVDFWIRIDAFSPSNASPFTQYEDDDNRYYVVIGGTGGEDISLTVKSGGSTIITYDSDTGVLPADGVWRHVAMVFIDNEIGFYVDGDQVTYQTLTANDTFAGNFLIGTTSLGTTYPLDGAMDEFRVYNGNPFSASPNSGKTDTIAVPTSAHTSDSDTKLLLHMDGNADDDGDTGHTVTNNGVSFGGLEFNGIDEYANLDNLVSDIRTDTSGSFSFWFKPTTMTGVLFTVQDKSANTLLQVNIGGTDNLAYNWNGYGATKWYGLTTGVVTAGNWYHFVLVQDGISPKIYINGNDVTNLLDTTDTTYWMGDTSGTDLDGISIGANYNSVQLAYENYFNGAIDDFRYYQNKALTTTEIEAIYNSGTGTEADQPVSDPENMTLISEDFIAQVEADSARIVLFEEDVDSITLNTDIKAYASRDGGTTYSQITLVNSGEYESGKNILSASVDISGQPAGTTMKYKVETLNNKDLKLHGTGLLWD